jgi:spermidine dehydrogenase
LKESYDLVVVGGGISGLSAAYFFQRKYGTDKKVLVLDNHDDFGGHAKRNEHTVNGRTIISYGGSQTIVEPKHASKVVHELFKEIGVDTGRFDTAYDRDFYTRHNLGAVTYFNKKVFGEDKVVRHPFCNYPNYIEGMVMGGKLSNEEAAQQAPLSEEGKEQLLRVLNGGLHLIDVPKEELGDYIGSHSYFDYLKNTLAVDDPAILRMARHSALDWALTGTDLMSIGTAKSCGALGFAPKAVYDEDNPYNCHFPDGNAGVARALVKKMIPDVARGNNAEELVSSRFDYSVLDKPSNAVRIRLNSTVVNVRHEGDPDSSQEVLVRYISNNKSHQVRANNVVMACYNMMIPHIVSDLPEAQAAALKLQTKSPLQYTTVGLKNWKAMKEMEIGMAMSPGNMHQAVLMDFPVSMGGYEYTKTPDDPCVIQMISCPYGAVGAPRREQYREARYRMLDLQFENYEQEIRAHLTGMLPKEHFDFDRDVESITVNRWAHGYTVGGPGGSTKTGRQPFGRVTIANCDSAPGADMKTAIDMASRAVKELV